jgi:glycosyltransferase involved in cell wall biosynthesis
MWGHGRTYTKPTARLQEKLKSSLTRRTDWFFAYTEGGAEHVRSEGYPPARTTVVLNTIDSDGLSAAVKRVGAQDLTAFRSAHSLHQRTAVFIGGLDGSKRLDFLLAAGDVIAATSADFRLLVIGDGALGGWLAGQATSRPWLVLLGHATGDTKALALAASRAILMPGRVGLVAVDSFAAAVPLVTTDFPWHAPEFEYLDHNRNAIITANDIESYSAGVLSILDDDDLHSRLAKECNEDSSSYSIDAMVDRFLAGLERALQTPSRVGHSSLRRLRATT